MTESEHFVGSPAFKACALIIFGFVALNFIFPSTYLFPLDRKTVATFGATLCYVTRTFIFRGNFDIIGAIDFNVLVLLASIMVINHIVVHLPEVKKLIKVVQQAVLKSPVRGFWLISFVTFVVAPFLTNDGVCLLFVEIICEIFEEKELPSDFRPELQLERADAPYFLLTLACSSNIGSALTYTGNPQNMIVGQEAISVLSPARFIGYMMIPSLFSWGLTTWWIQRCWLQARKQGQLVTSSNPLCLNTASKETESNDRSRFGAFPQAVDLEQSALKAETEVATQTCQQQLLQLTCSENQSSSFALSPLSPRKQRQQQREAVVQKMVFMISSPIPYLIVMLLIFMIVMIFVNVMSISGLVCITAVVMVSTLVLGTLCRGQEVWAEVDPHTHQPLHPHTHAERIESITDFCDALFESIDYSLLMIFLGLFCTAFFWCQAHSVSIYFRCHRNVRCCG